MRPIAVMQKGVIAGPAVPVTWNPADHHTDITLSGGDLIASLNALGGAWALARATLYRSSGKYYYEAVPSGSNAFVMVGVADSANSTADFVGVSSGSASYYGQSGQKANANSLSAYGATYASGDVIGVAMDFTGGTIEFFKNNVSQGVAFTSFTGSKAPAISMFGGGGALESVTGHFKAADLVYSPPSGYSPWE